jgi:hypothetical protein
MPSLDCGEEIYARRSLQGAQPTAEPAVDTDPVYGTPDTAKGSGPKPLRGTIATAKFDFICPVVQLPVCATTLSMEPHQGRVWARKVPGRDRPQRTIHRRGAEMQRNRPGTEDLQQARRRIVQRLAFAAQVGPACRAGLRHAGPARQAGPTGCHFALNGANYGTRPSTLSPLAATP